MGHTNEKRDTMSEPTALNGPMFKKGAKRTNWLQRHFTLFNGALCYYASKEVKTPKGFILTKDIVDCKPTEKVGKKSGKGEHAFEVTTKEAPKEEEKKEEGEKEEEEAEGDEKMQLYECMYDY